MKNTTIKLFSILLTSALFLACKNEEHLEATVTIYITSPAAGDTLLPGDTLALSAAITSDIDIHGYTATLTNTTTNAVLWTSFSEDHMSAYTIAGSYINAVSDTSNMKFKVIAEIDHDGGTQEKEVNFVCLPQ